MRCIACCARAVAESQEVFQSTAMYRYMREAPLQHQDGNHPAQVEGDIGQDLIAVLQPAVRREGLGPDREHPVRDDSMPGQEFAHRQAVEKALVRLPEGQRPQPVEHPDAQGQLLHAYVRAL